MIVHPRCFGIVNPKTCDGGGQEWYARYKRKPVEVFVQLDRCRFDQHVNPVCPGVTFVGQLCDEW